MTVAFMARLALALAVVPRCRHHRHRGDPEPHVGRYDHADVIVALRQRGRRRR